MVGYIVYAFVFLIVLGAILPSPQGDQHSLATSTKENASTSPSPTESIKTVAVKQEDNITTNTIEDILKSHNGGYEYEVMSASNDYVLIKLLPKTALNEEWMIKSSLITFEEIFRELFKNPKIERAAIMQMADFTDAYGKSDVSKAFTIEMNRATAEKIDWNNFQWSNLFRVADSYEIVPSIKKGLSYNFMQEYGIN